MLKRIKKYKKRAAAAFILFVLVFEVFGGLAQGIVEAAAGTIGVKQILGFDLGDSGNSYLNYVSPVTDKEFRVSLHRTDDDLVAYCLDRTKDSDTDDYNTNYRKVNNYKDADSDMLRNILLCGYPGNSVSELKTMYGYSVNKRSAEQATQLAIWVYIYKEKEGVSTKNAWKAHEPENTGKYEAVELSKAILSRALAMKNQDITVSASHVGENESDVTYEFSITSKSQYFPVTGVVSGLPSGASVSADESIVYAQNGSFSMNLPDGTAGIRVSFSKYLNANAVTIKVNGTIPATSSHDGILFYDNSDDAYQSVVVAKDASPVYRERTAEFSHKAVPRMQIRIKKEDSRGNEKPGDGTLVGAEYMIFDESGNAVQVLTIAENHQAISEPLPLGIYTVKETKAPVGYLLDETVYQVDGRRSDTVEDIILHDVHSKEEIKKGKIRIVKTMENPDSQSTEAIPAEGVVFTYYMNSNPKQKMTITLDKDGKGETGWLPFGTYTLEETSVPTGWKLADAKTVEISEHNKVYTYYLTDELDSAECKLIKKDKETGKVIAFAGTSFQIRKKDSGDVVSMYQKDGVSKKISEFVTNEKGYVILPERLQAGEYILYELTAPEGYVKEEEGIPFTVPDNWDETVEIIMENTAQKVKLVVEKTGETFTKAEKVTWQEYNLQKPIFENLPLEGVTYSLTAMEDIKTQDGTVRIEKDTVFEAVTDADGKAVFDDLYPGEYELVEVLAPEGYVLDTAPKKITLTYGDDSIRTKEERVQYNNLVQKPEIKLEKWMQKNPYLELANPEKEVLFGLYAKESLKNRIGETLIEPDTLLDVFSINEEGMGESQLDTSLPYGTYYMKELKTHPAYVIDEKIYEFSFLYNEESKECQTIHVTKEPIVNEMAAGSFSFHKVDGDSKEPLKGCMIELKNKDGVLIAKGETDEKGDFEIPYLPVGVYSYYEVTAPKGYVLDNTVREFVIEKHGMAVNVVMENAKEKVVIVEEQINQEQVEKKKIEKTVENHTKTGDNTPVFFWFFLMLFSFTLMVGCVIFLRKKK